MPTKKLSSKYPAKRSKRVRKGLKRSLLIAFLGLLLLLGGVISLGYEALQKTIILQQPVAITIKPGMGFRKIADLLAEKQLWPHPYLMAAYAKLTQQQGKLQAGYYEFNGSVQPVQVLAQLVAGKVTPFKVVLVEGQTLQQWLTQLQAVPELKHSLSIDALAELRQRINLVNGSLEGWFFPNTYQFSPGSYDWEILEKAHHAMQQVLVEAWSNRANDLPYQTPYEALIMASIIEKETAQSTERNRIAGVFVNRLRLDMKLQTDPTVIYGLGAQFQGNLTREHLRLPTAFNTYLNKGLPPTPIAMVSAASLDAALHPESTDALYFVAKQDGFHVFSSTLQAHNEAVKRYQYAHSP